MSAKTRIRCSFNEVIDELSDYAVSDDEDAYVPKMTALEAVRMLVVLYTENKALKYMVKHLTKCDDPDDDNEKE